jgi:hypothetical protein
MERDLATSGYKYLSSPFSTTTVSDYTSYLSATATIPNFYLYNENKTSAGWTSYTSGALSPMIGYAANLGAIANAKKISISGTVNNGSFSATLYNHNQTYTLGMNLVGNPYPSPIDWNAVSGWTKTNIDDAMYFFDATGAADEYSGNYYQYVNGVGTGGATNIVPSMQGFFVHVSNGSYPVTATLGMTNSVRTTNLSPVFKSASVDTKSILRFAAGFDGTYSGQDPFVLYFDPSATMQFDGQKDALKLMNTDAAIPNLYEIVGNSQKLSINGIPEPVDSLTRIPIGINALKEGWIIISATDLSKLPSEYTVYLEDKSNNVHQDLRKEPKYRFYANNGETNNRFALVLAMVDYNYSASVPEKLFTLSRIAGTLVVKANLLAGDVGELRITNMLGQIMTTKSITFNQTIEVGADWQSGIYVVTLVSGGNSYSEKTIIRRK